MEQEKAVSPRWPACLLCHLCSYRNGCVRALYSGQCLVEQVAFVTIGLLLIVVLMLVGAYLSQHLRWV